MYEKNALTSLLYENLRGINTDEYIDSVICKNDRIADFFQKLTEALDDGILEKIMMSLIQNGGNKDVKRT